MVEKGPFPPHKVDDIPGFRSKLRRTLQLRDGEWRLIAPLGGLLLVNAFAIQLSYVASVSGLLENGDVVGLPTVWLLSYLLTLALTSVQLRVIDRYDKRRLLVAVSLLFALLLYAVWWGMHLELPSVLTYGLLYVVADQQWLLFPLVFWAMCSDVLSVSQARRLFPIIASVGFVGKLLGLTLAWLAPTLADSLNLDLPGLLLLSFLLYVVAAILSVQLSERSHSGKTTQAQRQRESAATGPGRAVTASALPFLQKFAEYRQGRKPQVVRWSRRWSPTGWHFSAWLKARSGATVGALHKSPRPLRATPAPPTSFPPDAPSPSASPPALAVNAALFRRRAASVPAPPGSAQHLGRDAIKIGWQFIQDVPIFKYLALSVFVLAGCETILEFVFLFRLEHTFSQVEQYQSFYSGYRFVTTLLGFAVQALVTSRLIERLTLRNALSVTALILCGVSGSVLLLPGLLSSSLGMGVTRVMRDTIDESSQKALQGFIPSDKRGRVSLLIDSYLLSLGTVASCLLLLLVWHIALGWSDGMRMSVLMLMALLLAAVGVWSVLRLRKVYDSSLLNWRLRRRQRGGEIFDRLEF